MYATKSAVNAIKVPAIPKTSEKLVSCLSDAIEPQMLDRCGGRRYTFLIG